MSRYAIDFYKDFKMIDPLCGLVSKITSPKGVKKKDINEKTYYELHSDLISLYDHKDIVIEPGLYWVMNVCKPENQVEWYQYLFVMEEDGNTYPVAEFLRQVDSTWVPQALPIVKRYFAGETLDRIKLTRIHRVTRTKTRWDQARK